MSKFTPLVSLFAAAITALTALPSHGQASDLQAEFVFLRNDSLIGTQWSSIPFLSSTTDTEATLTSPDLFSSATTNQGAYSSSYASFQDLTTAASSGPWSLVIDPNGSAPAFTIDMGFPSFDESLFGPVTLTNPGSLTQLPPSLSEFSWSGPAGYSSIDFILQNEDFSLVSYDTLAPTQTSFTLNTPLLEGNYRLTIRYVTELTEGQVLVSDPAEATDFANTGVTWSTPQIKAWSEGSFELSVIPEPSTALLVGLGLYGYGFRRSRNKTCRA
jgi:hypothetical protein